MISESPFVAIFGATSAETEDSLVHIARAAVRAGFAVVPCLPLTKQPMCTLPARDVKRADEAAREAARAAGKRRWQIVRHECGIKHAMTDEKESDRVLRRLIRDHGQINLGVELGRSRVIVVDVDTQAEKDAFARSWTAATGEPIPFGMTVTSPGVYDNGTGEWKHKNGGHYWFTLPEGLELPTSLNVGAMKDETGWIAMWADRQVLVPPSRRKEGAYVLTGDIRPAPGWLLQRVVAEIVDRGSRSKAQEARRAARTPGDAANIDRWSGATSWSDLLEPDGWFATGLPDNCGCEIWTAPGVHASPKSATAHDVGCALYDDSPGHAPLHVWTDNPPDFLYGAMGLDKTFTKIQYVALRDHAGDVQRACRAEGIAREVEQLVALPSAQAIATAGWGPVTIPFSGQLPASPSFSQTGSWTPLPPAVAGSEAAAPVPGPVGAVAGDRLYRDDSGVEWSTSVPEAEAIASGLIPGPAPADLEESGPPPGWTPPVLKGFSVRAEVAPPVPFLPTGDPGTDLFEGLVGEQLQRKVAALVAEQRYLEQYGDLAEEQEVAKAARWAKARRDGQLELDRLEAGEEHVEPGTSWRPVDLSDHLTGTRTVEVPSLGVARDDGVQLLYPGKEHAVMGEMESGKSWFAAAGCAETLKAGGRVVYVHFEETDPGGTVEKLVLLGADPDAIRERFVFLAPEEPVSPGYLKQLIEPGVNLAVLDGVNEAMNLHGLGIREEDGAAGYRRRLVKPFTRAGAAVLSCDHVIKNKEARGRNAIGSVHKGNGIDGTLILLENKDPFGRGMCGKTHVFVTKDRPGQVRRHGKPSLDDVAGKTFMGSLVLDDTGSTERFTGETGPLLSFRAPGSGAEQPSRPRLESLPDLKYVDEITGFHQELAVVDTNAGYTEKETLDAVTEGLKGRDRESARRTAKRTRERLISDGWLVPADENTTGRRAGKHRWGTPDEIAIAERQSAAQPPVSQNSSKQANKLVPLFIPKQETEKHEGPGKPDNGPDNA